MTKNIVDIQQVGRHVANQQTSTEIPDVSDYLNAKSVAIDRAIGLQRMNIIKRDALLFTTHINIMDPGHKKFV